MLWGDPNKYADTPEGWAEMKRDHPDLWLFQITEADVRAACEYAIGHDFVTSKPGAAKR
jgi:hypothetical protein